MKPCWCILSCACRQPQSAEPEGNAYSLRNSQARAVAAFNMAGGNIAAPKPTTLEEQFAVADERWNDAFNEARRRRGGACLAIRASDGHEDDLGALASLLSDWQIAQSAERLTYKHREALRIEVSKKKKEAATNG